MKFANFVHMCREDNPTIVEPKLAGKSWAFPHVIQIYTKSANFTKAIFSVFYNIFHPNFAILLI